MNKDEPLRMLDRDPRSDPSLTTARVAIHPVRSSVDVFEVRRSVRTTAASLGFTRVAAEELAIVASELCTNIVKYGVRGELALDVLRSSEGEVSLSLAASDVGQPFIDFTRATRDRSDGRGTIPPDAMYGRSGIGGGLAAVRRWSDGVHLSQSAEGKTIVVLRRLPRATTRR